MLIMREFDLKDGTCWIALSYAMDECKVLGIEYGSEKYYDYVGTRKYEIWEALENRSYDFNAFVNSRAI